MMLGYAPPSLYYDYLVSCQFGNGKNAALLAGLTAARMAPDGYDLWASFRQHICL